ncbi:uncharacterized protein LOC117905974 isoform X1 [Vitis riparia]|uniref:uncharacterized protein LOC117905974 isoform X1 n=1 Tax=Vitis riparia TaxID=96939 RepID=UPI00155AFFF2|nr:uncharacterized protein LOC117905974 isoform X1 [Vitis riparia]XP_034674771.1 uncharacterized protein LOC117905974 isoform X1 [Vitis riparia]XP_034674772.1 uncharacterized protein LOC117905974 isoform X1 [Vitis riparia]XP_034674773.1 uncharacterized protein LOC117905974 isoform X1 [Vitis riparia]XP_034674774.1 uncharacterized protein LOC117905974 isoform X1 [Vitis riparia]XP_034674775.1 uncharacterized protein LOC117905974 isoform X1 [Vitis riparia]XP_034674777.1 uncharacterized protein LO
MLNMSPTTPYHFTSIGQLERTLSLQSSLCWDSKKAPSSLSNASIPSNGAPTPKSPAQLIDEIATLEVEIMHLERYLLSLYRSAFEQHLPTFPGNSEHLQHKAGSPLQVLQSQPSYKIEPEIWRGGVVHSGTSSTHGWADSDDWNYAATSKVKSRRDGKNGDLGHHSLGEYFGASHIDHTLHTPDKLSEDIVQCISSIYCKLANPHSSSAGFSVSSTSSLSSTSTFSVQNLFDTWSPHCNEGATGHHRFQGLKEENAPYAAMVEVMKLCLDDDSFNYAASMLQNFRSLVQNLAKVNPRKMKREGKLAFWINIHNALVMHAYLAYGIRNCVKGTSILKAAYNVGGHCVNAYDIQSSILGIRSHRPAPWLQTLLSPGNKSRMGNSKHIYAIEYPEPLVHFALCSGTYSDPVVRLYTAQNVFQNLKLAKQEFIEASAYVDKGTKIFLPKILSYFAKDTSLSMHKLLEVVTGCVSEAQHKEMERCMKGRPHKCIHWLPQSSTFRYVIHGELANARIDV